MPYVRKPSRHAIHAAQDAAERFGREHEARILRAHVASLERQLAVATEKLKATPKPVPASGTLSAVNLVVSVVLNPDRTVRGLSVKPA